MLVGVRRHGVLVELLGRRVRRSIIVVGVDIALAEGVVLGIVGHGEDGKCCEDGGSEASIGRACAGLRRAWGRSVIGWWVSQWPVTDSRRVDSKETLEDKIEKLIR